MEMYVNIFSIAAFSHFSGFKLRFLHTSVIPNDDVTN